MKIVNQHHLEPHARALDCIVLAKVTQACGMMLHDVPITLHEQMTWAWTRQHRKSAELHRPPAAKM